MTRFNSMAWRGSLMVGLGLGLAACGGGRNNTPPNNTGGTPPVIAQQQEDQFGARFGTAFRADNNSEPFSPADGDIAAISFTTEPVDIK